MRKWKLIVILLPISNFPFCTFLISARKQVWVCTFWMPVSCGLHFIPAFALIRRELSRGRLGLMACSLSLLGAGVGDIGVEVEDPQGRNTVELLVEDRGNQVYRCVYKPMQPGPHVVRVSFAGDTIPKSPFVVQVGEGECWGSWPPLVWHSGWLCMSGPSTELRLVILLPGPLWQEVPSRH